jgi:hypothetical protein
VPITSYAARGSAREAMNTSRKPRSTSEAAPSPEPVRGPKAARGKKGTRKSAKIVAAAKATAPTELMRIRELDPQAACGQGTTVMQLFRVDDLPFGNDTTHLVFFDRHGWYCAHGRECPAVAAVRKRYKQVTLTK